MRPIAKRLLVATVVAVIVPALLSGCIVCVEDLSWILLFGHRRCATLYRGTYLYQSFGVCVHLSQNLYK